MRKEFKNIDDLFRSELGGSETPVPSHVKINIDKALGFNNRKRGFIWLGLIALVLVSTAAAFYSAEQGQHEAHNQFAKTTEQSGLIHDALENHHNSFQHLAQTSSSTNRTDYDSSSNTALHHLNTTSTIVSAYKSNTKPPLSPSDKQKNNSGSTPTDRSANNLKTDLKGDLKTDQNQQSKNTAKVTATNQSPNNPKPTQKGDDNSLGDQEVMSDLALEEDASENNHAAEDSSITAKADEIAKETAEKDSAAVPEPVADITKPPAEDFKHWMIHLTGGPNFVRSDYTATSQMDKTTYDNATQDRIGSQVNLDFMYGLRKGLSFGSGIGLTNFSENHTFETKSITIDTIKNVEYVYDTTAIIIDSIITYAYEETVSKTNHNGVNKASYIHIPIHIGAQLIFGKLQVDIYSSIRFNFLTRSSGGYLTENQFVNFSADNSIFKPFYVDLMFGSRINYQVYKMIYASASVQYRPVLGNLYTTTSFNKSFDYLHLGLGLSLRF